MKYRNHLLCLTILSLLFYSSPGFTQENPSDERIVPEIRALRINPAVPTIDGSLDDKIWKSDKIEFARDFIQREPDEGMPAT
jgi:hypothetical protein